MGAADELKGQVIKCFVVLKQAQDFPDRASRNTVIQSLETVVMTKVGRHARPALIAIVKLLPKTRSGKIVRRAVLAVVEGRDPGDLSTLEDPTALEHIRDAHSQTIQ